MKGLYKETFRRVLAMGTAMGLVLTGVAYTGTGSVMADADTATEETETEAADEEKNNSTDKTTDTADGSETAQKDETVYIFTDASGNQKKVLVSDWLKNGGKTPLL